MAEYTYSCGHIANQPGATEDRTLEIRCILCRRDNPTPLEITVTKMSGLADQMFAERHMITDD